MDYEKNKEALVIVKQMVADKQISQEVAEKYFPELKESEDERIRKEIISMSNTLGRKDWIAWLEKQGEHKKFRDSIQVGDKVTRNEDGVLVNLSQLNRVAKKDEKQGEQKHQYISRPKYIGEEELLGKKESVDWSKDDEENLYHIDALIKDSSLEVRRQEYLSNWLKSLRPRSQWKPSDEQMYNLSEAAHYRTAFWDCDILIGLYDELKKLKDTK